MFGKRSRPKQALSRGIPHLFRRKGREARLLEFSQVLFETIAGKRQLCVIGSCRPLCNRRIHLENRLGRKRTVCAFIIKQVYTGIYLTTHGISRNSQLAANAIFPGGPCHRIKCRSAKERKSCSAGNTLCGCNTNAHTRKRTRSSADKHRINVRYTKISLGKHFLN